MFIDHRPIVILGMQRSGTSAVAGSLARLGVYWGSDDDLFPKDANNSEGYFEQRSLTKFCHKCLAFYQMQASSVQPLPAKWKVYPQGALLERELGALIRNSFKDQAIWGFKQPLACLLAPIFQSVIDDLGLKPQYVVCVRNPLEIQASEAAWAYGSGVRQMAPLGTRAVGAWLNYTLGALRAVQHSPNTVVPFTKFVDDPDSYLRRIVSNRDGWSPTKGQWMDAMASIKQGLKHKVAPTDEFDHLPQLVKRLFEWCNGVTQIRSELQEMIEEFESWQAMLAPQALGGTKLGLAWRHRGDVQSVQEPFIPSGEWQSVKLTIDAPPRTPLNGLLYNQACRIWIRRMNFRSGSRESGVQLLPGPGSSLAELDGILRLEGAYEPRQINLITPDYRGPYELDLEFLLESGLEIANDAAGRICGRLQQCEARRIDLERSGAGKS